MNIDTGIQPDAVFEQKAAERLKQHQVRNKTVLTEAKQKELKKVSQDFESLFLGMMFKSMRQTVQEDKVTGGGKAEETYRSMLDQEYVNVAAKRGSTGLAKMVEKELMKRYQVPVSSKPVNQPFAAKEDQEKNGI